MEAKDWTIYAARLPGQNMLYDSACTLVPVVVNSHGLSEEDKKKVHDNGEVLDSEGINISTLNPYLCELTAIYWSIFNSKADYIGSAHYRRKWRDSGLASSKEDVLYVPPPLTLHCSLKKQFIESHGGIDGHAISREVAAKQNLALSPEDLDEVWNQNQFYCCLMARGPREIYKKFMNILFEMVFAIFINYPPKELDRLGPYNKRLVAFIAERMLTALVLNKERLFGFPIKISPIDFYL